jgi:hypothetical protein
MPRAKVKQKPTIPDLKLGSSPKKSPRIDSKPKLQGKNLERVVEQFQSEPDEKKAHEQWKRIEASVFGVQFED